MTQAETIYQLLGGGSPTSLTNLQKESQRLDPEVQRDVDGDDHYLHFSDGSVLGVRYRRRSPNKKNQLWLAGVS